MMCTALQCSIDCRAAATFDRRPTGTARHQDGRQSARDRSDLDL